MLGFESYLSNRIQKDVINETVGNDNKKINCNVPQESVLGPILFLCRLIAYTINKLMGQ